MIVSSGLQALQALRLGVGFHVHPLGEERVFIRLMANYPGLQMDKQWWGMASRNPLVPWCQQGFQPVLYVSILYLLTEYLFRRTRWRGFEYVPNGGIALLCPFALVIALEYNRVISEQTMFERKFETGLKKILPSTGKPTRFVVKMKGIKLGEWYSGINVSMSICGNS
jgi:hypothetical protein